MITFMALVISGAAAQSVPGDSPAASAARSRVDAGASVGLEYQEGDFGSGQQIETITIPVSAYANRGRLQLSATLPYLRVDAPSNVIGGGAGVLGLPIIVDPTKPAVRTRREGLGDLRLNASYTVPVGLGSLALWNQVKVPTASAANGLGTGQPDYTFGAEVAAPIGHVTPFVSLGYTLAGDPEDYELRNSLSARAGANLRLARSLVGRLSYAYAQSPSAGLAAEQSMSTALHTNLSPSLSLGLYGSAGLSKAATDFGAGVQFGISLR